MKSAPESFADFIDALIEYDRMVRELDARELPESPRKTMPVAPQHPRPCPRTPLTAQKYLRTSRRRTQGRKGRLQGKVKA